MGIFLEWLLLKETANITEEAIRNYALHLLDRSHNGVELGDYKTLLSLASKFISNVPPDNQLREFEKIRSLIMQVASSVKGEDMESVRSMFVNTFSDFYDIERKMILTGLKKPNQLQYEDFIQDAIEGTVSLQNIQLMAKRNISNYAMMDKDKRRNFLMFLVNIIRKNGQGAGIAMSILERLRPDKEQAE